MNPLWNTDSITLYPSYLGVLYESQTYIHEYEQLLLFFTYAVSRISLQVISLRPILINENET